MLALIALIMFGVGVIAVAAVLLRSAPAIKARKARDLDPELAESEVQKKLYGKRSLTVSAPLPAEAPANADAASARTLRAMSRENVEGFKRATEAGNRRDYDAMMDEFDPDVEWHPAMLASLEGQPTVFRGREGVRRWVEQMDEAFAEIHTEFSEIRDLDDRILAIGIIRTRGKASGADTESPIAYVVESKNGKATRIRTYLDPKDALEAAELSD